MISRLIFDDNAHTTVVSIRSASERREAPRVDALVDCPYRRVCGCLLYMASVCLFRGREISMDSLPELSVRTFETLVLATNVTTTEPVDGLRRHYCESAAVF